MAPILSLTKECLDNIRKINSFAVVSIWEVHNSTGSKTSCRSGFVFDHKDDNCIVLTLKKDLDLHGRKKIFVQFENGQPFEGTVTFGDPKSNLAAIIVDGIGFEVKNVSFSEHEARQCDGVIHMGCFDEKSNKLNFSSGMIGVVGHNNVNINKEGFTGFAHCCSERLYLLGAPVFNQRGEVIGLNFSQKDNKDLFFALDQKQLRRELDSIFGEQMERLDDIRKEVQISLEPKRRKKQL